MHKNKNNVIYYFNRNKKKKYHVDIGIIKVAFKAQKKYLNKYITYYI